ncbi:MAG: kinase [Xanthomonadales bacterium]|nr:kinase [Xanthomonadales bacterium]
MGKPRLADRILTPLRDQLERAGAPFVLGVSGLQGSGKSTLARQLLDAASPHAAVCVSLDDVYLSRAARLTLARTQHPLLATRGVPGTHDVALLMRVLDELPRASVLRPVRLPRFDKGRDDTLQPSAWPSVDQPPRLIVLEGWCLGVPAQADAALIEPINALEAEEDRDGRWRRYVNAQLRAAYAELWQRVDHWVVLQAPDFEVVSRWRDQQERALRERQAPQAMDTQALARFIAHYERLSRHALAVLPERADTLVRLDAQREVLELRHRNGAAHMP